ncbi:PA containing protein [Pseudonocardia abyssalis]|uniref:PA containing protein n=2 Tax=Pseudonocardia abyssalis TaxID=2792008 RepID=A0ABS6V0Z9_9PSEU|nr:PA containing protein [Pseudonocardia abyssalis]MBW0138204.1 PA containing protein [Pseudonocardia abyssalis]
MSNDSIQSFDRMRGMLVRAAEIRDSEQQQIFDSLDEIHARLAALDALGTVRKRLTELPDRTEVSVLAERLDETVAKLDAQDATLASVMRALEALPDKLAKPFAQLDGRLDGMAGRMEGISGRMDGLDDRLGGLHKRLDDLDNRLDRHEMRLDAMPSSVGTPIKERIEGIERVVREQLDGASRAFDETGEGLRNLLGDTSVGLHRRLEDLAGRPAVDPTEPLDGLAARLESLAARLDAVDQAVTDRLESLDKAVDGRFGSLDGRLDEKLARLDAVLVERPDAAEVRALVERANEESERRNGGQLDEAMATFAELILGRGGQPQSPPPPPRPTQRRSSRKVTVKSPNGASAGDTVTDDPDDD